MKRMFLFSLCLFLFVFNAFSQEKTIRVHGGTMASPQTTCQYRIALYDSFGDGWNGGTLDVLIGNPPVPTPLTGITLSSGYGPANFPFDVTTGDQITTVFHAGSYPNEPYYYIYDNLGGQVWYSAPGSMGPPDILPTELDALCQYEPPPPPPNVNLGPDVFMCNGQSVTLDAGNPGATYDWSTGATTQTITVSTTGIYWVTVTDANGSGYDEVVVYVYPPSPPGNCDYRIDLYDMYGDGWNGGSLEVLVDGISKLNITLSSGSGPAQYYFNVPTCGTITTIFTAGSWPEENYYYIIDSQNNQVWYSPSGNLSGPPNILAGQLNGMCPVYGNIKGQVFDYDGYTVSGATVTEDAGATAISDSYGHYLLTGLTPGNTTVACTKPGYNPSDAIIVNVIANATFYHNFMLVQPEMAINPMDIFEVLLPTNQSTINLTMTNYGEGSLGWQATVSPGDDWLTMDNYAYTVPVPGFGGSITLPVHYNANLAEPGGGVVGTTYTGNIVFASIPDVGTIAIPVSLTIADPDMAPVPDMDYFYIDPEDGKIMLKWDTPPGRSYLRYIVIRNGQSIDTTSNNYYIDILDIPGHYCYKVCSLSEDGFVSEPTAPVCLYYPFPPMVPISIWALLLGGLLIGAYTFAMIRRR
jgi:hypothetical protein